MPLTRRPRRRSPNAAAHQAGALFALAGLVTLPGMLTLPGQAPLLLGICAADLTCAAVAWALPWERWSPLWPAVMSVPALAIVAVSTWAMGGFVGGTAPFLLLTFVWIGLNFPAWVIWAVSPLGVISYVVPLLELGVDALGRGSACAGAAVPVAVEVLDVVERGDGFLSRHLGGEAGR